MNKKQEEQQARYKELATLVTNTKKEMTEISDEFKAAGFRLKSSNFVKDEEVYVEINLYKYYDRYVGEKGAMYNASTHRNTFEEYDVLIKAIKDQDKKAIEELGIFHDEYGHVETDSIFDDIEVLPNGDVFYSYSGGGDQGELEDHDILITKMKVSEIKPKFDDSWDFVEDHDFEYSTAWSANTKLIQARNK